MTADRFNLSAIAIRRAPLTVFLLVLMVALGCAAYLQLGRQEDPNFVLRVMVVRATLPGATATEVELQLVDKLERKLQETPHLKALQSYAKPGEAVVMVELKDDFAPAEVAGVWYQVRKKVGDIAATLPPGTQGPFFNDEFGDTHIATYAVTGPDFSAAELRDYADLLRTRLLAVPGVEKVDLIAAQEERIVVELDSRWLSQSGLGAAQIGQAIAQQNGIVPAGIVQTGDRQIAVRLTGAVDGVAAIGAVPVSAGGRTVRLADIATVRRGLVDPPQYRMRFQGQPAVGLGVVMSKRENVLAVGAALDAAVAALGDTVPKGLALQRATYQPAVVEASVDEFLMKFGVAVGIVLLVSFFSLGLRSGIVVALSIPLVLAVTFVVMMQLGISFQRISLGALIISLGLLVDDAMISVEMMQRKLEEGWDKLSAATHAYTTTAFPMLTGTLITVAGFLPPFLAKSITGEYVGSLFVVVGVAMLTSWIVSVYFTPYFGKLLLKEHRGAGHEVFDTPFYRRLRAFVDGCLRRRWAVIAASVAVFVLGGIGMGTLEKQFFPFSTREEILVDLWLPEGATFAETERTAQAMEDFLLKTPALKQDLQHVASYVGGGAQRFYLSLDQQLMNTNLAQLVVTALDVPARERLITAIRGELAVRFAGVRSKVDRLPSGPPTGWPVQVRVRGPDPAEVRRIAEQVKALMRTEPDVHNVHDNWHEQVVSARLELDQARARALGVSNEAVNRALAGALNGNVVSALREGDKTILVELRSPAEERTTLDALQALYVPGADGRMIPLSQVARSVPVLEDGVVWRRNRQPTITVQGEVTDGVQSPAATARVMARLDTLVAGLPAGYQVEAGGSLEESRHAEASVQASLPIVYLVTFVLLLLQLNSLKKSILVLLTAPLGIIGASAALHLTGQPFGFVAILGLNALSGMIMRNAVILVDQIGQETDAGTDLWNAIVESTVRRFRPIVLTAAAAVLAFIPLTHSSLWGPMAIALIGGLLVATLMTLTFLPALYAVWFKARRAAPTAPASPHALPPQMPSQPA